MKKLIYQHQSEVFEKVVCDRGGRLFRVRFVVVEREGTLRGRIISCVPLSEIPSLVEEGCHDFSRDGVVCLPIGTQKSNTSRTIKKLGKKIASPYFNKFRFLTAIKIRAPSFK